MDDFRIVCRRTSALQVLTPTAPVVECEMSPNGGWRTRIELFVTEIGKWIPSTINLVGNSPDRSNEKLN
jgi:hypothetical protein